MILLIGSEGSIGKRYRAILKHKGVDFITFDRKLHQQKDFPKPAKYDAAIIATPTDTHFDICKKMIRHKKRFLCEKPLSKNLSECEFLHNEARAKRVPGFVVNNYGILIGGTREGGKVKELIYDHYHHGSDHILWDCCQLLNICDQAMLGSSSPIWRLEVNGKRLEYRWVEQSYVDMIDWFVRGVDHMLWPLREGVTMTKKVLERAENEGLTGDSSKD